jgi:hypothetical protein
MSDGKLEAQLRDALRPVAPSEAFTEALLAKLSARSSGEAHRSEMVGRAEEPHGSETAGRADEERGRAAARKRPPPRDRDRAGRRVRRLSGWWLSAGLAATLLLAVGVVQHVRVVQERERGLEARREVIEALRVTNQKLDLAYRVVRSQSTALADGDSGV